MKRRRKILLRPGSIGVTDCWWRVNRGGIDVCVYGEGFWAGCSGDCNYAAVPTNIELLLAGSYNLSGTVVHYHTGLPIAGMPVSFILPTRTRYSARTDSRGRFKIRVKHDPRAGKWPSYRVDLDYGKMETAPEAKHIVLWGDLTRTFRNASRDQVSGSQGFRVPRKNRPHGSTQTCILAGCFGRRHCLQTLLQSAFQRPGDISARVAFLAALRSQALPGGAGAGPLDW